MEENSQKKGSLEDLPKEELIKKCKALLVLAQKAKQAKLDVSTELNAVKEDLQKLEKKNAADQESLRTMQEFVETLTEQKLYHTTEIDSLRNLNAKLQSSLNECQTRNLQYEEDNAKLTEQLKIVNKTLANADNEITSLKRQNSRLEGDNEKLIDQLGNLEDEIEKLKVLGLQQQQQLLALEKDNLRAPELDFNPEELKKDIGDQKLEIQKVNKEKLLLSKHNEELLKQIEDKNKTIMTLEEESSKFKMNVDETLKKLSESESKLSETEKIYESEKSKKEKLNLKLKLYKDKLIKCNSSISQLKNSKSVLLKTVSDYSESVPKWQQDILNASKLLSEQLLRLESENIELKNKLASELTSEKSEIGNEEFVNLTRDNNLLKSKLNSIELDLIKLQEANMSLNDEIKGKQVENESLINNCKSLESEKLILINEKKSAKDTINKIENEKNELQSRITELTEKVEQMSNERSQLKITIDSMKSEKCKNDDYEILIRENEEKYKSAQDTIDSLRDEISSIKCAIVAVEEENKLLHESNEMLKSQLNNESDDLPTLEMRRLMEQNDLLQTDISKLQTKASSYKHENTSLHNELKEIRQRQIELENLLQDYESMKAKFSNYKTENSELLKEMKEINQVLKERGEVISKQQMEIAELTRKSNTADEEIVTLRDSIDKKDGEFKKLSDASKKLEEESEKYQSIVAERDHLEGLLKERNTIIISLEDDIEKLKQNTGNISYDARSDNMSVSTVSKVEENSRLKDVDESFEERYSKLRILALKLKKKVGELTLKNKSLEETITKFEEEKQIPSSKTQIEENVSITSSEEIKTNDNKYQNMTNDDLIKQTDKLNADLSAANLKINTLSKNLDLCKMEKASLDIIVKEYQTKIASQNSSLEELKLKEAEIIKIRDTLTLKESQLSLEISQHQTTREALEKSKKEVKKKSVLSLEMEDYERSMKDMTNKMEEDKKKIIQMESTIDTQQATVTSLKTQIRMLEEQLHSEEKVSKELRDSLSKATENLKEKENLIASKNECITNLEKNLEELKLQNEDINLQLASALAEKEKVILSLETEKSELILKFKVHENKFNDVQEKLNIKSIELEELKSEFSGYKVRAQSVLRQNNNKDLSLEENLKEEMAALKVEIESLRNEANQLKIELETVQLERTQLLNRCNELQSSINIIKTDREKIAEQYSILLQKEAQEQNNFKLQMSTLTQCYKKQLSDLEESTAGQIAKLKKELEFSRASIARAGLPTVSDVNGLKNQFVTIESKLNLDENDFSAQENNPSDEINVSLLEREEGEGSESTPSPSPTNKIKRQMQRGKRDPMPLEQLLEVDIPDDTSNSYSDLDVEQQLVNALKQLEIRDRRLSHMTEIVAEAEKEVARRSQLVETLKEEVRRCQRALDRGVHHHNQEYLKNVIVKFLTLSAGDERSRLVPVLNTILTLSPEETNRLNAAARGIDSNANRSWGSYLPWPSNRQ